MTGLDGGLGGITGLQQTYADLVSQIPVAEPTTTAPVTTIVPAVTTVTPATTAPTATAAPVATIAGWPVIPFFFPF